MKNVLLTLLDKLRLCSTWRAEEVAQEVAVFLISVYTTRLIGV